MWREEGDSSGGRPVRPLEGRKRVIGGKTRKGGAVQNVVALKMEDNPGHEARRAPCIESL